MGGIDMKITPFLMLHIAVCASLLCWLVSVFSALRFFSTSQSRSTDGLSAALGIAARWGTAFAAIDLIAHILAWLYSLSALGTSPLESLLQFSRISFLGGVTGMIIAVIVLVRHRGASPEGVALIRQALRFPCRLIVFGLVSIAVLAFIAF